MIETLPADVCKEWDEYVSNRPDATCHHLSGWTKVARRAYGLQATLLVSRAAPGRAIRGVLPLVVVPRPFGRYVTTGLFGAYGPVLGDDEEAMVELLDGALRFTDARDALYLHVKALGDAPMPAGFRRHDVWAIGRLPLEGGADGVWRSFKSSIRAAVRQALKNDFELRTGAGQLEPFYDVLAENMHRKGSPIYGTKFMRGLMEVFASRADVLTLWKDSQPVAGALVIAFNGAMYVPFASARPAYFPLRPNNLLYWRIIERACAAGLRMLDFGSSLRDSSTLAFKRHWGAVVEPVASYLYCRTDRVPLLTASSPAVQAGVRLWERLPRFAADALGPAICRLMV